MIKFQVHLKDTEVVPKPARLSRAARHLQSDRAQRYLHNQELLRDEFWLIAMEMRLEGNHNFPIPGPLSLLITCGLKGKRRMDRTNIEKSIEDALVKAGIIEDDNISILPDASVSVWQGVESFDLWVTLKEIKDRRKTKP